MRKRQFLAKLCLLILYRLASGQSDSSEKPGSHIEFPKTKIPALTNELRQTLLHYVNADKFVEIWEAAGKLETTTPQIIGEDIDVTFLVPSDDAFSRLIPSASSLPDPFICDGDLMQRVMTNHVIVQPGGIPRTILESLNQGLELKVRSLGDYEIVFARLNGSIYANHARVSGNSTKTNRMEIYQIEDVLVDEKQVNEAMERMSKSAYKYGDDLPLLEPRMSFGLRQVGAHLFGSIWSRTKDELQNLKAKDTSNICHLPKEVGPCRSLDARFFFNSQTKTCEPFAFGGCAGNKNNFLSLKACAERCIDDTVEFDRIRAQICQMPIQQFEGIKNPLFKSVEAECTEKAGKKYHYDLASNACLLVDFPGCFGTDNLFEDENSCQSFCRGIPEMATSAKVPVQSAKKHLYVYAPSDAALEEAIKEADLEIEDFLSPDGLSMSLHLMARHISHESCVEHIEAESVLDDYTIKCSQINALKTGDQLNGVDYTIVVLKKVPFSLNELAAIGARINTDDDLELKQEMSKEEFLLATSSMRDDVDDLVQYLDELPHKKEILDLWLPSYSTPAKAVPEEKATVRAVVCSYPLDEGQSLSESDSESRFYFDNEVGSCRSFIYLGNGGNLNNFKTFSECEDICGKFPGSVAEVRLQGFGFSGALILTQMSEASPVFIFGQANGLVPGLHGFHVYENDDLSEACKNIGSHFNPTNVSHGGADSSIRHIGDLGNLDIQSRQASIQLKTSGVSLYGPNSIIGKAIAITTQEDDLGQGGNETSLIDGNSGTIAACGIIDQGTLAKTAFSKINNSGLKGTLSLSQNGPFAPVVITGQIDGLSGPLQVHFNTSNGLVKCPKTLDADKVESARNLEVDVAMELANVTLYGYESVVGGLVSVANSQEDMRSSFTFVGCGKVELGTVWPLEGIAVIRGSDGVKGKIRFVQEGPHLPVSIIGTITGLPEGQHGFHIHQNPSTDDDCKAAGGHFNPHGHMHGGPKSDHRHLGDLGNIVAGSNMAAFIDISDSKISLVGPHSIFNRSLVIHADADDLGLGGSSDSATTGNAGARLACGVIQSEESFSKVISAKAVIDSPNLKGAIKMVQEGPLDFVHFEGNLFGLKPGLHGFHIHEGAVANSSDCEAAKGHFNPFNADHPKHAGDLANILAVEDEVPTYIDTFTSGNRLTLRDEFNSAIGKTIVITSGPDDLGNGGTGQSLIDGNSGRKIGCGLIKKSLDYMPEVCRMPAVTREKACPFASYSWTYDVRYKRCILALSEGCPYASKNKFATEDECANICPVVSGRLIHLIPASDALQAFLAKYQPLTKELRLKFRLCHTVLADSFDVETTKPQEFLTLCGEKIVFTKDSYGWKIDGGYVLEFSLGQKVILIISKVLGFDV